MVRGASASPRTSLRAQAMASARLSAISAPLRAGIGREPQQLVDPRMSQLYCACLEIVIDLLRQAGLSINDIVEKCDLVSSDQDSCARPLVGVAPFGPAAP